MQNSEALSKKVARGSIWVFATRIINRSFGFIRTIIIARLLAPEDFGLFGIAMLAIATLETFSQTGFQAALIHKKGNVESYLDTAWTVSAIRGVLLFLILFFSAPLIASFFNSPQAELVIIIIAVSTIFSGFTNIGVLFFQKDLEFNKQFIYEFAATIADLIVTLTLAFILRNVWALVWGGLTANLSRLFLSYILHPYRPHVRFEKSEFKELLGFGKWVFSSSILIFLITQGDDIFVGKILGVTALGLYQMAYLISNLPASEVTHVISQVTFPAYAKLQPDIHKLKSAYLKVAQVTLFFSFLIAGLIFILASDFTKIFLGDKWISMVPAMQILVIWGLIRSIGSTTGPIFQAIGKPEMLTKYQLFQVSLLVIIIYPLTVYGNICGTSLAVVFAALGGNIPAVFKILKTINVGICNFGKLIIYPSINTILAVSAVLTIKIFLFTSSISIINFICSLLLYGLVYFATNILIEKFTPYKTLPLLKELTSQL